MTRLIGCDFSSRPDRRKAIVMAHGTAQGNTIQLDALVCLHSLEAFASWLVQERDWVGGFDFPFGLPRELVSDLGWPREWQACMRFYASLSRHHIRECFVAYCAARPVGAKFAHRATDRWAGSSPSMKWVNPPVAYMLHAGVPALMAAGVCLPGLFAGDRQNVEGQARPRRIGLEAYPGLLAREVLGRVSYKSDDKTKHTAQRQANRARLVDALEAGDTRLDLRLTLARQQRARLIEDGSGDSLDAVLCLVQAAWGNRFGWPWFGLPQPIDPLEGWIVSALPGATGVVAAG